MGTLDEDLTDDHLQLLEWLNEHPRGSLTAAAQVLGAGVFKVPGLMRITVTRKPASKARMGINPFTKEQVMFKAKPARNVVRVRPLRGLKEMV